MGIGSRLRAKSAVLLACCGSMMLASAAMAASLSGSLSPARNFDLSQWKLTMPSGDEYAPAVLASGFQYADTFFTDPKTGGMVFRCPNIAGRTANTQYSRTELREMLDPGNASAKAASNNWTPEQGGWLRAKLRIDKVSTTGDAKKLGRVIIGQIHGPDSEPVRLYYAKKPAEKTGRLYIGMETADGINVWSPDIVGNQNDSGVALGENFTYQIKLAGTRLTVAIYRSNDRKYVYTDSIDPRYLGQAMYFKAGVYNQNNTGDAADHVQATFFILEHTH